MDHPILAAGRAALLISSAFLALGTPVRAAERVAASSVQEPVSAQDMKAAYDRALAVINMEKNHSLLNAVLWPAWIGEEDKFWYCRETKIGCTYTIVDARTGSKADLFDHQRLARELERVGGKRLPPEDLRLQNLFVTADRLLTFSTLGKEFSYDRAGRLKELGQAQAQAPLVSPDGTKAAFVRDFNLWVRDLKTLKERQLTEDGSELYAYALKPETRRVVGPVPEVRWSRDSKKLLTVQTDDRLVKPYPLVEFAPEKGVRPVARESRVALPGDLNVPMFRMVILDATSGQQTAIRYPTIPAVRMLDTPINGARAWWSGDNKKVYFVDIERGEKVVHLISADVETGETRELFRESHPQGYVELGPNVYDPVALRMLPSKNQMIWYSERSGSPQLYLYDLNTGGLIRQLTTGAGNVQSVLSVDERRDEAIIAISGRDPNKNPYYREIVRIGLTDGTSKLLSAGDDDRVVAEDSREGSFIYGGGLSARGFSHSGNYWVETRTRLDRLPKTVIRRRDGTEVALVEQAQIHGMLEGFRWPEPVMLTAADGVTPLQALVARPSNFDPNKRYPIIDYIYGGPQVAYVPSSFRQGAISAQQLAELGFIAVVIDGRGTTGRDRAFHELSYGAAETASNVEDHIAAIRQLAARYPYIDISRVGINGFSGGGYMTASAMMRFPDFYKVGVAESGNHDQRLFWHSWGERYQGLLKDENYIAQANSTYAGKLKGKLLLIHGLLDVGVHSAHLFQLTQKLMDENKNFDLIILPRQTHEDSGYSTRRRWDYFVENLLGQEPPHDFKVKTDYEYMKEEAIRRGSPDEEQDKKK